MHKLLLSVLFAGLPIFAAVTQLSKDEELELYKGSFQLAAVQNEMNLLTQQQAQVKADEEKLTKDKEELATRSKAFNTLVARLQKEHACQIKANEKREIVCAEPPAQAAPAPVK